jgi:flagellar biosynthesis chaperone FliJ
MRSRTRLQPLLALRDRRVTQAMQHVEASNRVVREKERARDAARARWTEADGAWRKQQRAYTEQVESNLHQDVSSRGLIAAVARCDWWRARVDECFVALQSAETALTAAEAAAANARRDYLRARARHDALVTLMTQQSKEGAARDFHAQEMATEDLQMNWPMGLAGRSRPLPS